MRVDILQDLRRPQSAASQRLDEGLRPPTYYADVTGAAYVAPINLAQRKSHGLYLTPSTIAAFMAKQIVAGGSTVRILDPAAGAGVLLCAAVEELASRAIAPRRIELVAYEVDKVLVAILSEVLTRLRNWAGACGIEVAVEIAHSDFVLEHAGLFATSAHYCR